ncbi:hypothetical protein Ocin01_02162 [Orchesella cincta]|uniref:Uncharacterized protein n=1 Tax=Orchesella cincta TaxID=48709 RepID=A0A1D2NHI9_ORCCI|nr:hypothetical protein Ocin01_02162 [Orchesella cincta]
MDSQNVERRDSKKSNGKGGGGNNKGQGRGGGNSSSSNNTSNGGKTGPGEKQRSHSQGKSKSYREREIYKPPSLRSSKNRNSNSSSEQQNSRGNIDDALGSANQPQPKRSNSVTSTQQKNAGTTNNNGSSQNGNYNDGNDSSMMPNNGYSLFGNGTGNSGSSSVPSSPLISNRMQNNFNGAAAAAFGLANRMYNVNAKEFQLMSQNALHQHQQQQQQISNFLSQFDPAVFYNNSPILASSGCYPLKQSKSSGNMNLLLQQQQQQQQQQAAAFQQLQSAMGFNFPLQPGSSYPTGSGGNGNGATNGNSQFNRLSQSKSSGNVPGSGKPRVRFDDEEPDIDDDDLGQQLGNYFASLKLNGDLAGPPQASNFPKSYNAFQQQPQQQQKVPLSPQPVLKSALQKSRTGFYLNLYGNQQQQQPPPPTTSAIPGSPTKSAYGLNSAAALAQQTQQRTQSYNVSKLGTSGATPSPNYPSVVKRSRSFGPGTHHLPRTSATTLLCATTAPSSAPHSVYSDFCITKWPKVVQELVTAAVTGVERIPARNWIEMVNRIFEAMLCDFKPSKKENDNQLTGISSSSQSAGSTSGEGQSTSLEASGDALTASAGSAKDVNDVRGGGSSNGTPENEIDYDEDDDEDDLATAAVHIFLYFIQREKDRTVMESLLNTCFASFQRLASSSINSNANSSNPAVKSKSQQQWSMVAGKPPISRQWSNFLRFLSTLYAQVTPYTYKAASFRKKLFLSRNKKSNK